MLIQKISISLIVMIFLLLSKPGDCDAMNMCVNSFRSSKMSMLLNGLADFFKAFNSHSRTTHTFTRMISYDELAFQPPPTMCLYSKTILITGGFACIFLWNIAKGELFKKINIKTHGICATKRRSEENSDRTRGRNCDSDKLKYSHLNLVKQIKVIQQRSSDSSLNLFANSTSVASSPTITSTTTHNNNNKNVHKLLLIVDYTDSIYVLKIPSNILQNYS